MPASLRWWVAVAWAGFLILPWYGIERGFFGFAWLPRYPDTETAPALYQAVAAGRLWLLPFLLPLAAASYAVFGNHARERAARLVLAAGIVGLAWMTIEGFAIHHRGWGFGWLEVLLGPGPTQEGLGYGALAYGAACLMLVSTGLAMRGWCRGDAFVTGGIAIVVATIILFIAFPVLRILVSAFQDNAGNFAPSLFVAKFFERSVWGLDCVTSDLRCGVAWNTLFMATVVGVLSTLLGLAFALIAVRTGFQFKRSLRVMSILPIITPPFVIGLAVILLFGRSGVVTGLLTDWFDIPRSRWIYGLPGIVLAQLLAFTPIAFLILVGVVQGVSPTLEEAAQTLRAGRWTTFRTVTFPLMRPGLANAFLVGFIESMADFGNPLVLGGNFEVLSTKIFFAVVGAAHDQGRAAVLAIVLLAFTLAAFWAQNQWVGKRSYATVAGKGDAGIPVVLPRRVSWTAYAIALPWSILTAVIYAIILFGGFAKNLGRDNSLTFDHYVTGFGIDWAERGLHFWGAAWPSFWTTLWIAAVSAPLTAAMGLLTAYLLARQRFAGRETFEFATMLSFAIPGTVIGVSYILAFNVPPIELTGTGVILIICFIFRNMPVGIRSGLATLSQIDKSLDEASLTLGARSFTTVRRIILPLLRPAIVAAMVYSFVRAITAVSAVIFLVSAQYNLATAYIIGRVEAGEFGLAIAYSSVLIVVMILAILLIQVAVGERQIGRRGGAAALRVSPNPNPNPAGG